MDNNQNEPKPHNTSFYPLDTLESGVYSRDYKVAIHKASVRKRTGIVLLCCGVFLIFLYLSLFFSLMKSQCQTDKYGWCGFAFFINLSPIALVGNVLSIIGIVKTIRAKRILENKKDLRKK